MIIGRFPLDLVLVLPARLLLQQLLPRTPPLLPRALLGYRPKRVRPSAIEVSITAPRIAISIGREWLTLTLRSYSFMFSLNICAASALAGLGRCQLCSYTEVHDSTHKRGSLDVPRWIRVIKKTLHTRQDSRYIVRWTPSILKDVQTQFPVPIDVWVVHFRDKSDHGRFGRIRVGECECKSE